MTQKQQTIWNYLTTNCVGINNAQNVATIAQGCDYAPHGTNNDNFRAIVTNMVVNEGQLEVAKKVILLLQPRKNGKKLSTG